MVCVALVLALGLAVSCACFADVSGLGANVDVSQFARGVESVVNATLERGVTKALSVAVTFKGRTVIQYGGGIFFSRHARNVFGIASQTKVLTSLLLYKLADLGVVNLSDRIDASWLPNVPPSRLPSFLQLVSHMGSLAAECPCAPSTLPFPAPCVVDARQLSTVESIGVPDSLPHYSNFGFALAGRALAKKLNGTTEELVSRFFLAPLGMNASGFFFVDSPRNGTLVGREGFNQGWCSPAGGMFSTTQDMATLLGFLMSDAESDVLSLRSRKSLLLPRFVNEDGKSGYGTPWELELDQQTGLWSRNKYGVVRDYESYLSMFPEVQLGISVLGLTGTEMYCKAVSNAISALIVPKLLSSAPPTVASPIAASKVAGQYVDTTVGIFQVSVGDDWVLGKALAGGRLEFVRGTTFRVVPPVTLTCAQVEGNNIFGQLLHFSFDSNATTFSAPGLYSYIVFKKL